MTANDSFKYPDTQALHEVENMSAKDMKATIEELKKYLAAKKKELEEIEAKLAELREKRRQILEELRELGLEGLLPRRRRRIKKQEEK